MQAQSALRVTLSIQDGNVRIESVRRIQKVVQRSAPVEGAEQQSGMWFAVEDANGRMLYRRLLNNFLTEGVEVYAGEEREFRRVHVPGEVHTLSLVVPEIAGGETFAIHASGREEGGRVYPAKPMFRVNLRQLSEMADKGGSRRGR